MNLGFALSPFGNSFGNAMGVAMLGTDENFVFFFRLHVFNLKRLIDF